MEKEKKEKKKIIDAYGNYVEVEEKKEESSKSNKMIFIAIGAVIAVIAVLVLIINGNSGAKSTIETFLKAAQNYDGKKIIELILDYDENNYSEKEIEEGIKKVEESLKEVKIVSYTIDNEKTLSKDEIKKIFEIVQKQAEGMDEIDVDSITDAKTYTVNMVTASDGKKNDRDMNMMAVKYKGKWKILFFYAMAYDTISKELSKDPEADEFVKYAEKIVKEAQITYISDSITNDWNGGIFIYDITKDLGLKDTGAYSGYVVIDNSIYGDVDKPHYFLYLSNTKYEVMRHDITDSGFPKSEKLSKYDKDDYINRMSTITIACEDFVGESTYTCKERNGHIIG